MEPFEITLVALATFAGATLQSATGFGYALLAGPATFAVFEPAEAITVLLALGTVSNLLIMAGERRESAILRGELVRSSRGRCRASWRGSSSSSRSRSPPFR